MNTEQEWPPQIHKSDLSNMKIGDYLFSYKEPTINIISCKKITKAYIIIAGLSTATYVIIELIFSLLKTALMDRILSCVMALLVSIFAIKKLPILGLQHFWIIDTQQKTIQSHKNKKSTFTEISQIILMRNHLPGILTPFEFSVAIYCKSDNKTRKVFNSLHNPFDEALTMALALSEAAKVPYEIHKSCKAQCKKLMMNMDE